MTNAIQCGLKLLLKEITACLLCLTKLNFNRTLGY